MSDIETPSWVPRTWRFWLAWMLWAALADISCSLGRIARALEQAR